MIILTVYRHCRVLYVLISFHSVNLLSWVLLTFLQKSEAWKGLRACLAHVVNHQHTMK